MTYFTKWLIILLCGVALIIAVGVHVINYSLSVIGWAVLAFFGATIATITSWLADAWNNKNNKL